jgi:glycosyltransferase involved in cell wall biosynthesis
VVPEDQAAFADAVVRVLGDPALRTQLRERGRSYARSWSSATMARRLGEIYRGLSRAPAGEVARAAG